MISFHPCLLPCSSHDLEPISEYVIMRISRPCNAIGRVVSSPFAARSSLPFIVAPPECATAGRDAAPPPRQTLHNRSRSLSGNTSHIKRKNKDTQAMQRKRQTMRAMLNKWSILENPGPNQPLHAVLSFKQSGQSKPLCPNPVRQMPSVQSTLATLDCSNLVETCANMKMGNLGAS